MLLNFYNVKDENVTGNAGNVSVSYAIVKVKVGDNNYLTQKVNIGLTVRVE